MFGLSFLSPLFLIGAAAVAIPIAIHLFYRRTDPVIEFAAMRYLRRAPVEQSRRRRLREWLLLALRAAALLLLALAFARPYVAGSAAALDAPATLVLLDTSASMTAPGRFARAVARAGDVIRSAPLTHAVGVVSFANATDVVAPLSQDRAGALAALAALKPGAGATRYHGALTRAAEELGGRPGRIVVVTDLQQSGWEAAGDSGVPAGVEVDVEDVGASEGNLAVTSLRLEGADAVAVVQSFSPRAVMDQVVFAVDGRRIGAVPVALDASGSAEARVPLEGLGSGALFASITDQQGYAADNVRYAVLDAANTLSVLAISSSGHPSESLYLERGLTIAGGAGGFRFRAVSGAGFSDLAPDVLAEVGVIVVLGTRGLEVRGRQRLAGFIKSGGGLLLTAGPDVDPAVMNEALSGVVRTTWQRRDASALTFAPEDSRHPAFRPLRGMGTLGNVSFTRAALVDAGPGAEVIARYSDGSPALVEERASGGRVLLFASDLNYRWNNFPLQPAFVPFVHETLRYIASARAARVEYLVGDLPGAPGAAPGVVRLEAAARAASGAQPAGVPGRRVAVNVDPRESDPARMDAEAFRARVLRRAAAAAGQTDTEARTREDTQRLWQYGLLLMVVSLVAEGVLGRRFG